MTEELRVTHELIAQLEHLTGDECFMPACSQLEDGARLSLELTLTREAGVDSPLRAWVRATNVDGVVRLPSGVRLSARGRRLEVKGDDITLDGIEIEGPGILVDAHHAHLGPNPRGRFVVQLNDFAGAPDLLPFLPTDIGAVFDKWLGGRVLSSDGFEVLLRDDGSIRFDGDLSIHVPPDEKASEGVRGALELRPLELSRPDAAGLRSLRGRVLFRGFSFGEELPIEDLEGSLDVETLRLGPLPSGHGVLRAKAAEVFGLRMRDVVLPLTWHDGILRGDPVTGILADGRLRGRFLLHTEEPAAYEGEARIDDFRLEMLKEDLAPTGPPVSGLGTARFTFQIAAGS